MFEGAKRSAEAKSTVLGPHGPWFERPVPGAPPKRALTLLVPALAAQLAAFVASLAVVVISGVIKGAPDWSAGAGFGALVGAGCAVVFLGRTHSALQTIYPAPSEAVFSTASQSRNRGIDRASFFCIYAVIFAVLASRHDEGIVGLFGGVLLLLAASSAAQLVQAMRAQRRVGAPLGTEVAPRAFSMFSGHSVFVRRPS